MAEITAENLNLPTRFNLKFAAFASAVAILNLGVGWALERVFAAGFSLYLSLWLRFLPLIISYLLATSATLIFSLILPFSWRQVGYGLSALGFGLPFLLGPHHFPAVFALIFMLVYLLGLVVFDFYGRQAAKTHAVFKGLMFWPTFNRIFLTLTLIVGFLVYFSSTIPSDIRFKIPEGYLDPALDLIINQVALQVQTELGTQQFTEEQFLAQLKETGLLAVLEEQFGIEIDESQLSSPEELVENIREPLAVQLSRDVESILEDFLGPYLPYLPLAAAVGVVLSLLFLSPFMGYLAVGFFVLFYRTLVWAKLLEFVPETRQVPVLKLK